jgi:hypothetical protein
LTATTTTGDRQINTKVDKAKFDALLRKMIATPPTAFKDVVSEPKPRKGGGVKRSAKKS